MDTAYVPVTAMTDPPAWHIQPGVLPSGNGYDLGTVVSISHVTGHGWVAYTKRDDITGSTLERLNAWHVTGPWHVAAQRWPAAPAPGCGWTYSAQAHPASPAPAAGCSCPGPAATITPARHATWVRLFWGSRVCVVALRASAGVAGGAFLLSGIST